MFIVVGLVLAVLIAGTFALLMERQSAYDSNIERIPEAFPEEAERPRKVVGDAQNWLLIGSDRRPGETGFQRADTIMLVHLPADRRSVYLVGIPRDAYVAIPGRGNNKINAAYAFGGPKLLIKTVEKLSGVRVDHFAALDFAGFTRMTRAIGGVEVHVSREVRDPWNDVVWPQGKVVLEGEKALLFVRQRANLPGGDFDRIKRAQAVVRAIADKVVSRGTLTNPLRLNAFLEAATKSFSVDANVTFSTLRDLALELRDVRPDDLTALTMPNDGSVTVRGASVVKVNRQESRALFQALAHDALDDYIEENGGVNETGRVN
ncbi:cell envelope-related function transcriptional attenuator common domain-containing protein [Sinosporangium album]|uniref:Cell envelope-related function transcriptional attenuator common domain-containing protein n=1 Tax=Sinosporangium album TaxID=504805 RepID=A0A1G8A543_9ACTN|nr:LCP family protein [Sinosporangium album]SDH15967.1 cell envelope-related function transcriptional attenuator common domain-containing protein [Sinosporangium album]